MFVIFVGALAVFLIIGMLLAWVGNKVLLAILKDNAKAEKEIEESHSNSCCDSSSYWSGLYCKIL